MDGREQKPRKKSKEGFQVMNENENLVAENATPNTENTAEQTKEPMSKTYTDEEVNALIGRRLSRQEAKIRKEYDREYGELMETLRAGTGKESVGEINNTFREFYQKKGLSIPHSSQYSQRDIETLAMADADEIIQGGFDEVVEEANRLKELGVANMTARDKAVFKALTSHIKNEEGARELSSMGVTEDVYNSAEFRDFQKKFASSTPMKDIYEIYQKMQPKKEIKPMGSMKNNTAEDGAVKDFYSYEEALKFTKEDFDKNPELFKAVEASMQKWRG